MKLPNVERREREKKRQREGDRGSGLSSSSFFSVSPSSVTLPSSSRVVQLSDRRPAVRTSIARSSQKGKFVFLVDRRYLSSIKDTVFLEFGPLVISLPSYGFWKHQRPVSLKTKYVSKIFKLSLMCTFFPQFESSLHHVMAPFNTSPPSNGWSRTMMNTAAAASPGRGRPW